jgi:hypothetical protein
VQFGLKPQNKEGGGSVGGRCLDPFALTSVLVDSLGGPRHSLALATIKDFLTTAHALDNKQHEQQQARQSEQPHVPSLARQSVVDKATGNNINNAKKRKAPATKAKKRGKTAKDSGDSEESDADDDEATLPPTNNSTKKKDLLWGSLGVKDLFERLCSLCRESELEKKLGACRAIAVWIVPYTKSERILLSVLFLWFIRCAPLFILHCHQLTTLHLVIIFTSSSNANLPSFATATIEQDLCSSSEQLHLKPWIAAFTTQILDSLLFCLKVMTKCNSDLNRGKVLVVE